MRIAVGLSGGVDSSVAALLLKNAGHEVIGVTMKIWQEGRYQGGERDACFGPGEADDIRRAKKLAQTLGIEYHVFDCAAEYERTILEYFRREYLSGGTPNPCVFCNASMKFGVLPGLARKSGLEFEYFATGHYAGVAEFEDGPGLCAGVDAAKDQSYFLYRLNRNVLKGLLFPLSGLTKPEVRRLAAQAGLSEQDKPDSQDFYSGDHVELLNTPARVGNIVDASGRILGTHNGFWNYTIGQRKGLGIAAAHPLYVLELNSCRNEVVVGSAEQAVRHGLTAAQANWLAPVPATGTEVEVKVRSAGKPLAATVREASATGFRLEIPGGVSAPARGQSAVLYAGNRVLGGGVIKEVE